MLTCTSTHLYNCNNSAAHRATHSHSHSLSLTHTHKPLNIQICTWKLNLIKRYPDAGNANKDARWRVVLAQRRVSLAISKTRKLDSKNMYRETIWLLNFLFRSGWIFHADCHKCLDFPGAGGWGGGRGILLSHPRNGISTGNIFNLNGNLQLRLVTLYNWTTVLWETRTHRVADIVDSGENARISGRSQT